jgi:hypothetical protein
VAAVTPDLLQLEDVHWRFLGCTLPAQQTWDAFFEPHRDRSFDARLRWTVVAEDTQPARDAGRRVLGTELVMTHFAPWRSFPWSADVMDRRLGPLCDLLREAVREAVP